MNEKTMNLLNEAGKVLFVLDSAIDAMKNGESELSVCRRLGIKKGFASRISSFKVGVESKESFSHIDDDALVLSGGEKLYKDLTGRKEIPYDAAETAEWCLFHTNLTDQETQAIYAKYYDGKTLEEIAELVADKKAPSRERIRQMIHGALRKIRLANHDVMVVGSSHKELVEQRRLEKHLRELEEAHKRNEELRAKIAAIKEEEAKANEEFPMECEDGLMTVSQFVRKKVSEGTALSTRVYNIATRGRCIGIKNGFPYRYLGDVTIEELTHLTTKELAKVRNMGEKSLEEMIQFFESEGVYLADRK